MSENCWEWTIGIVDTNERYFELKYGFEPAPVVRIGIAINKKFIVEFLFSPLIANGQREVIFREVIYEIELYLINNSVPDPIEYMIKHTQKCANTYSRVHWRYFPKGSKREILLTKEPAIKNSENAFFNFFSKIKLDT
ncbi:MAG: hypothetical protein IH620_07465 [Ignavibacterium sp.]|nr:hypothetical protein [Ignavibacterium sp.]